MGKTLAKTEQVIELAFCAGSLLLENGAEISRVEETMERICVYYGVRSENAFVLSNGIFITFVCVCKLFWCGSNSTY